MAPSLLHLPREIRERIYRCAGLAMNRENLLLVPGGRANRDWNHLLPDFTATRTLLRICRTITNEVAFLLYSTNTFYVRYTDPSDLQPLLDLSPASLRAMRSLRVNLNAASCVGWACSQSTDGGYPWSSLPYDRPLLGASIEGKRRLGDWYRAVQHIGAHIQGKHLHFAFTCDCADLATAQLAVDTFLGKLPPLDACSVRLGRHRDAGLLNLAEYAAFRAVGREPPQPPPGRFQFLDLPLELRLLILDFTDLITPMREVSWDPDLGYHIQQRFCACKDGLPPANQIDSSLLGANNDWSSRLYGHYGCKFRNCVRYSERGCFCKRYHSACTTASPRCYCWEPPTYMFYVSHAFRRDAQAVFFTKNRFTVCGKHPPMGSRYPVSIFLTDAIPKGCLRYLRFLEIVFAEFDQYEPRVDPAFHDWQRSIEAVQDKLDLPLLTVRMYMKDYWYAGSEPPDFRITMTGKQGRALQQAYQDMSAPLKEWGDRGLNRFFAHFPWPWDCTDWGSDILWQVRQGRRAPVERKETLAERVVMGPAYDSMALGKTTTKQSEWLIDDLRSLEY